MLDWTAKQNLKE